MTERVIYAVHAVRSEGISATQFVTADWSVAEAHACVLSKDPGVLAAAVTRFVLDEQGRRTAVALFVAGVRQQVPHVSDDRRVLANGHGTRSNWAPR
jgi:hypothetical protein